MRIGIYDISQDKTVYSFSAKTMRTHIEYQGNNYIYYEIGEGKDIRAYYNDNGTILYNENYTPPQDPIELVVQQKIVDAIKFGHNLTVKFATENVLMGITQAGKTKEVSDYLADVTRYCQTGSLYEVINEIDRLIASGIPTNLSPFITVDRLNEFKQSTLDYLNG